MKYACKTSIIVEIEEENALSHGCDDFCVTERDASRGSVLFIMITIFFLSLFYYQYTYTT
jgi:hypothetical protein